MSLLFTAACAASAGAQTVGSLAQTRATYKDIVIVEIGSGQAVYANSDRASFCYYHYQGKISDVVRGTRKRADFSFDTMSGLELGARYMILVSDADALGMFRAPQGHFEKACERLHTGYYFLYDEVNRIDRFIEDGHAVDRVKISGPFLEADFKGPHMQAKTQSYVDLDDVKEKFQ